MKKNIFYGMLIALALLNMSGCGGGASQGQEPFSVSKYKSLKQNSNITAIADDDSINSATKGPNGDVVTSPNEIICNSGTVTITGANVNADNCTNSGLSLNGSAAYQETDSEGDVSFFLKANTDIVLEDSRNKLMFKQNSYFEMNTTTINDNNNTVNLRVDTKGSLNDVSFAFDINVKVDIYECHTNWDECTETSVINITNADITLGNYRFVLDAEHSNVVTSTTPPMSNEVFSGGVQWIEVGTNHDVQISFEEGNQTYLKIDENGDGTFSSNEVTEL